MVVWVVGLAQAPQVVATQGADASRVEPLMKKAIELEPEVIIYRVVYAKVLAAWNKKEEVKALLHPLQGPGGGEGQGAEPDLGLNHPKAPPPGPARALAPGPPRS
ncbi:hypothetical protein [Thermus tengchongensis]|uniref:hypothetical protein n=1 Tax=Thermus tengchongensis TaxID=1214928 RepID=UPI0019803A7A|nr:hypothetical protein [Thermus tengchongensis]